MSKGKLTKVQRKVLYQVSVGRFNGGMPYTRYLIFKRLARRGYIDYHLPVQRSTLTDQGRTALSRA
jgi:hypothetical protein